MSHSIVLILVFATIAIYKVQSECDQQMCTNICQERGFPAGNCNGNSCDCSYSKKCSEMVKFTCQIFCKRYDMVGVCLQNDFCFCRASIKLCVPTECTQQCLNDGRAAECMATGGVVIPVGCVKYADIRTCVCMCQRLATDISFNSVHETAIELFRYNVTSQE